MNGWIGISLGDVTGIGPEVALKAVAAEAGADDTKYLFIGDRKTLDALESKTFGLNLPLKQFSSYAKSANFSFTNPFNESYPKNLLNGSSIAAIFLGMTSRRRGNVVCAANWTRIVTAPVNKESIIRAGHKNFVGQTEFFSELAGTKRTAMMLLGHDEQKPLVARRAGHCSYFA